MFERKWKQRRRREKHQRAKIHQQPGTLILTFPSYYIRAFPIYFIYWWEGQTAYKEIQFGTEENRFGAP